MFNIECVYSYARCTRTRSPVYKEVLETKVLPRTQKIINKPDYVFQLDGEPAHTVRTGWTPRLAFGLKTNWPSQSLDLDPLEYSL